MDFDLYFNIEEKPTQLLKDEFSKIASLKVIQLKKCLRENVISNELFYIAIPILKGFIGLSALDLSLLHGTE